MVVSLLLLFYRENCKSFERKISTIVTFAAHYCNVAGALYIILSFCGVIIVCIVSQNLSFPALG
jgi:hypothetical protein